MTTPDLLAPGFLALVLSVAAYFWSLRPLRDRFRRDTTLALFHVSTYTAGLYLYASVAGPWLFGTVRESVPTQPNLPAIAWGLGSLLAIAVTAVLSIVLCCALLWIQDRPPRWRYVFHRIRPRGLRHAWSPFSRRRDAVRKTLYHTWFALGTLQKYSYPQQNSVPEFPIVVSVDLDMLRDIGRCHPYELLLFMRFQQTWTRQTNAADHCFQRNDIDAEGAKLDDHLRRGVAQFLDRFLDAGDNSAESRAVPRSVRLLMSTRDEAAAAAVYLARYVHTPKEFWLPVHHRIINLWVDVTSRPAFAYVDEWLEGTLDGFIRPLDGLPNDVDAYLKSLGRSVTHCLRVCQDFGQIETDEFLLIGNRMHKHGYFNGGDPVVCQDGDARGRCTELLMGSLVTIIMALHCTGAAPLGALLDAAKNVLDQGGNMERDAVYHVRQKINRLCGE